MCSAKTYANTPADRANRTLKNTCLAFLVALEDAAADAEALRRFRAVRPLLMCVRHARRVAPRLVHNVKFCMWFLFLNTFNTHAGG